MEAPALIYNGSLGCLCGLCGLPARAAFGSLPPSCSRSPEEEEKGDFLRSCRHVLAVAAEGAEAAQLVCLPRQRHRFQAGPGSYRGKGDCHCPNNLPGGNDCTMWLDPDAPGKLQAQRLKRKKGTEPQP